MGGDDMQDDHNLENGSEESEYHFSDEGVYETPIEETEAPELVEKRGLGAHFASYRRFIIMGGVFAGILLVVYLLVTPPTVPTPTEITAASTIAPPTARPEMVGETKPSKDPSMFNKMISKVSVKKNEAVAQIKTSVPTETVTQTTSKTMPALAAETPSVPAPIQPKPETPTALSTLSSSPMMMTAAQPQQLPPTVPDKTVIDRLAALEEANAKMITQLNAEYAHRLAEFEMQNKAFQEQMRNLSSKLSGMEAQMTQIQQNLSHPPTPAPIHQINVNDSNGNTSTLTLPSNETLSSSNKTNYAVQAIIPGRAWLRTENGETVTVAEGDMLKGLGRVTKIDPHAHNNGLNFLLAL